MAASPRSGGPSGLAASVGFAATALAVATLALIAPTGAHAAFSKGPYQQDLTQTGIVIRWETSTAQDGTVQYGLMEGYGSVAGQTGATTQHEIALSALLPDTLYYFRAISGSDTSAGGTFHTPFRAGRPFRFLAYGDNRTNTAAHQSVIYQMTRAGTPGLIFNVGDLTATGSTADFQTFFNVEQPELFRTPLYPSIGNHDTANIPNYLALFSLPNNERWYSVRYGSVSFHVLDNYSTYTPGSAQYNWFLNELRADSADATVRHIVVSFHEPPYTTNTGHASNLAVRQYICPLLERFKVKLTFQGHVHCYEHSLVNGVHYIVTGGGGAPLYTTWGASQPWTIYRAAVYEFVQIDVRGDTLDVKTIKPGGMVIDPFRIVEEPSPAAAPGAAPLPFARLDVDPNPASGQIRLSFELPHPEHVTLAVYDTLGHRVCTVADGVLSQSRHSYKLSSKRLAAGVYFAVLKTEGDRRVKQFVVVR